MRRETEDKGTIWHQYHQERCSTSLVNPASMTHGLKLRPTDTLVRVIIYFPNDILYFRLNRRVDGARVIFLARRKLEWTHFNMREQELQITISLFWFRVWARAKPHEALGHRFCHHWGNDKVMQAVIITLNNTYPLVSSLSKALRRSSASFFFAKRSWKTVPGWALTVILGWFYFTSTR